jgi:hypothetical protein
MLLYSQMRGGSFSLYRPLTSDRFANGTSEFEAGLKLEQQQRQNTGISPLRRAMKLRDFGRDDDFVQVFIKLLEFLIGSSAVSAYSLGKRKQIWG